LAKVTSGTPVLLNVLVRCDLLRIMLMNLTLPKTRVNGLVVNGRHHPTFIRFDTISACDEQTDRDA